MQKIFRRKSSRPQDELKELGINLQAEIGSGTYATVYKGVLFREDESAGENVAVKVINLKTAPKSFTDKFLAREIAAAQTVNHCHVIKFEFVEEGRDHIYFVTELARTDLLEYLRLKGALRETLVRRLFYELASGINYLHQLGIVHRDIKCENCLISNNGTLKVADFGFARSVDENELCTTYCGSTVYAAPEILSASAPYDPFLADTWSCGIVLYIMFTAKMPFSRENLNYFLRLKRVEVPRISNTVSEIGIKLLHGILLFNPEQRYRLNKIAEKKHEWYTSNALN